MYTSVGGNRMYTLLGGHGMWDDVTCCEIDGSHSSHHKPSPVLHLFISLHLHLFVVLMKGMRRVCEHVYSCRFLRGVDNFMDILRAE